MSASTPEALHRAWVEGVNRGDLDGLAALYEPDAAFVSMPGTVVTGAAAIRGANASLIALNPRAELVVLTTVVAGDLALIVSRWSLEGIDQDGQPLAIAGQTSDVARKQSDGTWRFAIDNPWGDAITGG